jgi:hypothetical protein
VGMGSSYIKISEYQYSYLKLRSLLGPYELIQCWSYSVPRNQKAVVAACWRGITPKIGQSVQRPS